MRTKLIMTLAYGWRKAENTFLNTHSDNDKWIMMEKTRKAKLTKEETKELYQTMNGMGI